MSLNDRPVQVRQETAEEGPGRELYCQSLEVEERLTCLCDTRAVKNVLEGIRNGWRKFRYLYFVNQQKFTLRSKR